MSNGVIVKYYHGSAFTLHKKLFLQSVYKYSQRKQLTLKLLNIISLSQFYENVGSMPKRRFFACLFFGSLSEFLGVSSPVVLRRIVCVLSVNLPKLAVY